MVTLYNCHHDGDQYQITKFTDGNPESSYLTTHTDCQCPRSEHPTCRHRQMLPIFINSGLINTHLFLNWDNGHYTCDFQGNPTPPHEQMPERSIGPDCKSGALSHDDSNPSLLTTKPIIPAPTPFVRRI